MRILAYNQDGRRCELTKYNDKAREYSLAYAKAKLKRVPLDLRLDQYEQLKAAADHAGQSVNAFIKTAIQARISAQNAKQSE